mmetsp:Transcript_14623/g.34508  ORF Transcript_14623/g.34508 Transcript_14623/m.34508 type:complete len:446 (+) Transcript_14623:85-1422(+)
MAIQSFRSKRSAPALRLAALLGVGACVIALHPVAFTVKGVWDTPLSDAKEFPAGFGPDSVAGMVLEEQTSSGGAVSLTLKDRLGLAYKEGPFSGSWDDTNAWQANYTTDDLDVLLSGLGAEPFAWKASKTAAVEGLGDVQVNVSSADGFGVGVARDLPQIAGMQLKGYARARNDALLGRLVAERTFGDSGLVQYSMENPEGEYEMNNWTYKALLTQGLQDGTLTVKGARERAEVSYNVSYERSLDDLLKGAADSIVGLDTDGLYGKLQTSHSIGKKVQADVVASGKSDTRFNSPSYAGSLKLSHDLGSVKLSTASDEPVEVSAATSLDVAGMTLSGKASTIAEKGADIKYNVTLSKDLSDVLSKLEGSPTGSLVIGSDAASEDGLYGRLQASRALGNDFVGELSMAARGREFTPAVKVSNQLGYAQLSKPSDSAARLKVGYEFSA